MILPDEALGILSAKQAEPSGRDTQLEDGVIPVAIPASVAVVYALWALSCSLPSCRDWWDPHPLAPWRLGTAHCISQSDGIVHLVINDDYTQEGLLEVHNSILMHYVASEHGSWATLQGWETLVEHQQSRPRVMGYSRHCI
jgi:hypothetical protein